MAQGGRGVGAQRVDGIKGVNQLETGNGTVHLCLITTIYSIYIFNPILSNFCVDAPLF